MDRSLHDRISRVAYDLYEKKGRRSGCEEQDWIEAESIVMAEVSQEKKAKEKQGKVIASERTTAKRPSSPEMKKKAAKPAAKTAVSRRKKSSPEATI